MAGNSPSGQLAEGVTGCVTAQTRYLDDPGAHCVSDGMDQVVLLGVGYRSRACRLAGLASALWSADWDDPWSSSFAEEGFALVAGVTAQGVTQLHSACAIAASG